MTKRKSKRKPRSFEQLKKLVDSKPRVTFYDKQSQTQVGVAYGIRRQMSGKDEAIIIHIKDVQGRTANQSFNVDAKHVLFC